MHRLLRIVVAASAVFGVGSGLQQKSHEFSQLTASSATARPVLSRPSTCSTRCVTLWVRATLHFRAAAVRRHRRVAATFTLQVLSVLP